MYSNFENGIIQNELRYEFFKLSQFFKNKFKEAIFVPKHASVNKLIVLENAKRLGLNIPKTFVCTKKSDLKKLKLKYGSLISKAIGDILPLQNDKEILSFLTLEISEDVMNELPCNFFPSLVQVKIEKNFEIRSFYFFGKFYSMAIFSQKDEMTKVDFRNYNYTMPNRMVPYVLPRNIELKLNNLMNQLGLNTGSIDLIKNGNYFYFLEINPVGQFGMVDYPTNAGLFRIVAEKLIELDKNKT